MRISYELQATLQAGRSHFLGELVLEFISYSFLNFMYILYIIFRKLSSFLLLLNGGPGRLCSVVVRLKGVYSAIELQTQIL